MRGSVLYEPSSFSNQKHYFVLDTPRIDFETSSRFKGLLRNATDFRAKPSTLKAIRNASSSHYDWKACLELTEKTNVHPNHALRALASEQEVVLATSPRRISRKLNALRGQLVSAPASLQGHLHSACYKAMFKSGDLTTSNRRGDHDERALCMRSGTAPYTPRSALIMQSVSNTGHSTPVFDHSKLAPNWGRPPSGSTRKTRPSTAATAAAAAAGAAEAREKVRTAPATLFSDYDLRKFQTPSSWCRHCGPVAGKIHHGSTLKQQPDSAMKVHVTLEEEQRRARRPIKSVTLLQADISSLQLQDEQPSSKED